MGHWRAEWFPCIEISVPSECFFLSWRRATAKNICTYARNGADLAPLQPETPHKETGAVNCRRFWDGRLPQKRHRKKQQVDLPMFTAILLGLRMDILAEGAIALSVTLSGGALFAS